MDEARPASNHESNVLPPCGRFPFALLLAVVLLMGVEAGLRAVNWERAIPYESGIGEYHAAAARLDVSSRSTNCKFG